MSWLLWSLAAVALYAALAAALAGPAHRLVYPLVGWGHPMTGRRLAAVRIFSPFVLLAVGAWRLPTVALLMLVAISLGARPR